MVDQLEPVCYSSIEIDPELNICSDQFNPLEVLISEENLALNEIAPIYDNKSLFEPR